MKFNMRFIITLTLIVLIIISFVFIILESLYFSNRTKYELETLATTGANPVPAAAITFDKIAVGNDIKFKALGTSPDKLVNETQYYRYGSLLMHVLAMLSGAYVVYSG